ncbi:MAG: hypothetical protein P1V97_16550, partial [Planctomycetota bacterium]|nr:hypothetical protein [Planctomycetota bacterium]
ILRESKTYKTLQEYRGKALINLAKTLDQTQINRTELQSLLTRLKEFQEPKFEKQRLFQIARLEYRLGRYEQARRALMGWRKYGALTAEAELFLGELYVAEGSLVPALQSFERVLRKDPKNTQAFLNRQSIQIQLKHDLEASLGRLMSASKTSPEAMGRLISAYLHQSNHRFADGLSLAKNQWKKDKTRTHIAEKIVESYLFHSRPIDALEIIKELRGRSPKDSRLLGFQILAEFLRKGVMDNSEVLKELLELKNANQETVLETLWLFNIAEQRQKKQKAELAYDVLGYAGKKVKDAFPRRVLAEYRLANVFLSERKSKGEVKTEETKFPTSPDHQEDRYQRAVVAHYFARWGQRASAEQLSSRILKDSPNDSLTAFSKAHLSEDHEDINQAYEIYINDHNRVGTILYKNARALFLRSLRLKHKNDFLRACVLLDFARRRDPWALPNYEMQVRFAFQSGRLQQVGPLVNHWLRLAPYDPKAQIYMGLFLLRKKDTQGASKLITKAYKTLGETPLSFRAHIQLLLAQNKHETALLQLNRALKKNRYQLHLLQARVIASKKLGKLETIKEDQEYIDCMVDPEKASGLLDGIEEIVADDFEKAEKIVNHAIGLQPYNPDCLLRQAAVFKSKKGKGYILKAYLNLGDIFLHNFGLLDDPKYDFKNHIRYVLPPDKYYKQMETFRNSNRPLTPRETWTTILLRYIEVMNGFKDPSSIRDLLPLLDRVLHAFPEKLSVRFMQGWVRVLVGDNGGRAILEECLSYCPDYGPALFALAFAEARNSQSKAAFSYLEKSSHRAEVAEKARHFKVFDSMTKTARWNKLAH